MVACETTVTGAWEYACSKIMLWRARPSRFGVIFVFAPRKPMRSARVEPNVMRTIFGEAAARAEIAGKTIEARSKSAAKFRRSMESVYRRDREANCTRASRPRPHCPGLTSTFMGTKITVYFAPPTNSDTCPPTAGVRCGCAADFLPGAKMAWRSEAHHPRHRRHGPAAAEQIHG